MVQTIAFLGRQSKHAKNAVILAYYANGMTLQGLMSDFVSPELSKEMFHILQHEKWYKRY